MRAPLLLLALAASPAPEPAPSSARPLVIFVEHFGSDLYPERAGLVLASACKQARPVTMLARRRGRVDHLTPEGAVVAMVRRADIFSALASAFRDAGKGADVVYLGAQLPLGTGSTVVSRTVRSSLERDQDLMTGRDGGSTTSEFHHVPRPSLSFDRALAALRKSGATFHALSVAALPDEGMRVLAQESGGTVWIAGPNGNVPADALDRLSCR